MLRRLSVSTISCMKPLGAVLQPALAVLLGEVGQARGAHLVALGGHDLHARVEPVAGEHRHQHRQRGGECRDRRQQRDDDLRLQQRDD